jgi:hypothetical protein
MSFKVRASTLFMASMIVLGAQSPTTSVPNSIVGRWVSTKMTGTQKFEDLLSSEIVFNQDLSFTTSGRMKDGSKPTSGGQYSLENGRIKFLIFGETQYCKIEWIDGQLVIHEDKIDAQTWYTRVSK